MLRQPSLRFAAMTERNWRRTGTHTRAFPAAAKLRSKLEIFSRKNWPTEIIETFERHGFIWAANGSILIRCISSIARKLLLTQNLSRHRLRKLNQCVSSIAFGAARFLIFQLGHRNEITQRDRSVRSH